mmetsp:Transcript_13914/g.39373  ORF Transcript_13914/g.39373 Transcript_13914/m.39373 type:complete len:578 (-) Transcript_13914:95-1828(-)|eukprot:CAMPEP_0117684474 /NCGR_PEP_ID=MMETSP0804-20121206/21110_1 /TAXON_ID=1074897 /ORGANISM="Tetraselmis astigmatica, Strain CCMP880" /LENGTH=577 /DNA_ID=CAMNT_0005495451 /DNA_START=408 /DNA_END=2141 /DNA_ORIENTATION=+
MHPNYYHKRTRGRRSWGTAPKVILLLAGLGGVALVVQHSSHASEVNGNHSDAMSRLRAAQHELELNTLNLAHTAGALKTSEAVMTAATLEAESTKGELENAFDKCESLKAQLEADNERDLSDKTFDWKEEVFRRIRTMEDELEEQRTYWEAQLKPLREQTSQLRDRLQGHRIDLAKSEVSRIMYRAIGNGNESEAVAFLERISAATYSEPFTLTQAVAARFNSHKGLWTINVQMEKKVLGVLSEQFMEVLPEEDILGSRMPRSGKWGTCALVGSSGILKKYKQGKEIDLHDAIWRLDNAPVEGFEEHVGSHTTIRIVSDEAHVETRMRPSRETILQLLETKETMEEFVRFKTEQQRDAINVHVLSPEFMQHLSKFMLRNAPRGFYALGLALHKCRSIDVYGFTPSWQDSFPFRYWDNYEPGIDVHHQQGPMRDPQAVDFTLMAELARHSPNVRVHEPCLTWFAAFGACDHGSGGGEDGEARVAGSIGGADCGVMALSESAVCVPGHPLPQPRPGFCADPPRKQTPANCFRRCPGKPGVTGEAQCAGETVGPACEAVGISVHEGMLAGVTCPASESSV